MKKTRLRSFRALIMTVMLMILSVGSLARSPDIALARTHVKLYSPAVEQSDQICEDRGKKPLNLTGIQNGTNPGQIRHPDGQLFTNVNGVSGLNVRVRGNSFKANGFPESGSSLYAFGVQNNPSKISLEFNVPIPYTLKSDGNQFFRHESITFNDDQAGNLVIDSVGPGLTANKGEDGVVEIANITGPWRIITSAFEVSGNSKFLEYTYTNRSGSEGVQPFIVEIPNRICYKDTVINPDNGHVYYLTEPLTWTAAQAEAESFGGNLVTINDEAELDWLLGEFGIAEPFWIGLNDATTEGTFEWVSGATFDYDEWIDNWNIDEPNSGYDGGEEEDYVVINFTAFGDWGDVINDGPGYGEPVRGIVEIED